MSFGIGRLGRGFGRLGAMDRLSGASTPAWLPLADAIAPKVYADFAAQNYWYNGAVIADWATFLSTLSGTLDGSSSRYYTNVAGTLVATTGPRFDYDPVTHVARGILLEGARTNVIKRSQEFDNASWDLKFNGAVTANAGNAPDGTVTADKFIPTTANAAHVIAQTFSAVGFATSTAYSWSLFAQAAGYDYVVIRLFQNGSHGALSQVFNLATGALGASEGSPVSSIRNFGGGIYRLEMNGTTGATSSANDRYDIWVGNSNVVGPSFAADGTSGVLLWGAQLEAGAFASSYIPTTSGSVTRAADSLVFTPISWFNQSEGALFGVARDMRTSGRVLSMYAGTLTNRMADFYMNTETSPRFYSDPTGGLNPANTITALARFKAATSYKVNDCAFVLNGGTAATDATTPAMLANDTLEIGGFGAAQIANGHIEQIGYWNTRVSNAGLQTLTA